MIQIQQVVVIHQRTICSQMRPENVQSLDENSAGNNEYLDLLAKNSGYRYIQQAFGLVVILFGQTANPVDPFQNTHQYNNSWNMSLFWQQPIT